MRGTGCQKPASSHDQLRAGVKEDDRSCKQGEDIFHLESESEKEHTSGESKMNSELFDSTIDE